MFSYMNYGMVRIDPRAIQEGTVVVLTPKPSMHYVNVSVLKKFSLKTSVFYLNYHKISIKSYMWMCIRIASVRRF